MECVCFTLIVDDIVQPTGKTYMGVLGGGGPQTLFGYQLQRAQAGTVGLAAGIGPDIPSACVEWLAGIGADTCGLLSSPHLKTPRAWQIFEFDGKRTQVWRVPETDELYAQLLPKFSQLPPSFQQARSYHLGVHPLYLPRKLLASLRAAAHASGGLLSAETYTASESAPSLQQIRDLATCSDILSPNELEAISIVGPGPADELADRLLDAGATTVTIRMGPDGAFVKHGPTGEAYHVPACLETTVVDVTGCGNAFCGGFLGSYSQGEGLLQAGLWGCAAASIIAEQQGVPALPILQFRDAALQRLETLRLRVPSFGSAVQSAAAGGAGGSRGMAGGVGASAVQGGSRQQGVRHMRQHSSSSWGVRRGGLQVRGRLQASSRALCRAGFA